MNICHFEKNGWVMLFILLSLAFNAFLTSVCIHWGYKGVIVLVRSVLLSLDDRETDEVREMHLIVDSAKSKSTVPAFVWLLVRAFWLQQNMAQGFPRLRETERWNLEPQALE